MATADVNLTVGKRTGDEHRVEMPGVVVGDSKQTLENGEPININQTGISTPTIGPSPYLLHGKLCSLSDTRTRVMSICHFRAVIIH